MTGGGNSASREAAAIRARARRGVWRRVTAALGVNPAARRADARAALWDRGAASEEATAALLAQLLAHGWQIRHDLRLPGRRFNIDHVLISPCGTAIVVLDTKAWHLGWPTELVRGRVHCGTQDRHEQVEKVARYAAAVQAALGLPGLVVWPLLVIHGSPVARGELRPVVAVPGWQGPVWVLSPDLLVPRLVAAPQGVRDPARAGVVVSRVDQVLAPYS